MVDVFKHVQLAYLSHSIFFLSASLSSQKLQYLIVFKLWAFGLKYIEINSFLHTGMILVGYLPYCKFDILSSMTAFREGNSPWFNIKHVLIDILFLFQL